ncbi:MAG: alpha-N-arabinofuranosidase [Lachnospiraceae bacterium]|nr:alpha-N-arabinofuranosidase [Ruminococcus sp.]MCM1274054.1 alpha-N-arabinofuranosidase [Lachnospiraceae bacterium]
MKALNMVVNAYDKKSHINAEIYGHFSEHLGRCIYKGIYVGENSPIPNTNGVRNDVIEAFKAIKMPVLRWPGGCFADEYHWRDGVGEKSSRKKMVNTNWGHVTEDNSFGTHEFFELCEEIGCEPYLAGNLGSGTVQELADWIEYITFDGVSPLADLRRKNGREKAWRLKYLGIGNENWGCGGNMRPEFYADEYRRYQTFCKNFSGNELFKIACGPSGDDYNWTDKLLETVKDWHARAISLHYYTIPTGDWSAKGSSTEFSDEEYYKTISGTLFMDELIRKHAAVMSKHSSEMKLIIDEWGCWYEVEPGTNPGFLYQQNTMRDAIVAACNLNIFNLHSDIVCMANLAQAVNVLQALLLTEGEKLVKTPTYHVFDMFKTHQNSELLYSFVENTDAHGIPAVSQSASINENGEVTVTMANCSLDEDLEIRCGFAGFAPETARAVILTGDVRAFNDFDAPERVKPAGHSAELADGGFKVTLPRCSVVSVVLK